ncbi:AraC family transcriptional regulator [Clostridium sp. 19966]|uniref:AraC family transcriptional regulator n=1 Tax=Clostridium sp. 19966 TaxID=2768166 RepID=UPI0028E07192|nr:AraC family transcriptional regulator [Clostridium sp. 19966]MDT8715667.1 AraC family transcriptional regulator [Clostridium sp. 19966]
MLFIIVSGLIYLWTDKNIKSEINNSNTFMLSSIRTNMDNSLENIKKVCLELSYNSNIQDILSTNGNLTDADYFNVYKIASSLKSYASLNNSINGAYIMLKNYNKIITADGIFDLEDFFKNTYSSNNNDFVKWLKEFDERTPEKYFTTIMDKDHSNNNKLNYVRALSQINYLDLSVSSGIVLNETNLLQQLSGINTMTKGVSFILDSKNNIIASSVSVNLSNELNFKNLQGKSGVLYKYINSKKVVISYISSKETDWKYVTMIPNSVFFQKLNYIKYFTLLGLLLSMVFYSIFAYYSLKKNYNPITKLLGILKDSTSIEESNLNEYTLIEKAIQKTLADNDLISNKLSKQNLILKNNFLQKLLKGGIDESIPLDEGLSSFDITFESNYFAVISLFINDSDEDIESLNCYWGNRLSTLNFILSNIIIDLVNKKNKAFVVEADNNLVCLINFKQDNIFFAKSDTLNTMNETEEFINKNFKTNISFSMSGIHENIENIAIAYNESLYAMNYKNIMGIKQNISYDDINSAFKDTYCYPLNQEHQLLNHIKSGNYAMASKIVNEIFSKNLNSGMNIELAQCLMLNMVSTMIRAVNDVSDLDKDKFLQELNPIKQLLRCKTLNQMKNQLDNFLKAFCAHVNKNIEKSSSWVISSVIPYLEKNYNDPNIGLEQLSEQFGVHPVYLSKIFKDHVGEGLLDYISKLRIEQAKVLLKANKNSTIEKIAELVGYYNVRTFSRVFKKYTNISPGKYKDEVS